MASQIEPVTPKIEEAIAFYCSEKEHLDPWLCFLNVIFKVCVVWLDGLSSKQEEGRAGCEWTNDAFCLAFHVRVQ